MRLDQERQQELEPARMDYAMKQLLSLGKVIHQMDDKKLKFMHKGHEVTLYPYSGWFTGKSVHDGRGIKNLLDQIKKEE